MSTPVRAAPGQRYVEPTGAALRWLDPLPPEPAARRIVRRVSFVAAPLLLVCLWLGLVQAVNSARPPLVARVATVSPAQTCDAPLAGDRSSTPEVQPSADVVEMVDAL